MSSAVGAVGAADNDVAVEAEVVAAAVEAEADDVKQEAVGLVLVDAGAVVHVVAEAAAEENANDVEAKVLVQYDFERDDDASTCDVVDSGACPAD